PKLVMASTITGNVANIGLDYLLVMVFDMGMFGASLATAIGPMVALSMMLFHFKLGKNNVFLTKDFWNKNITKRLLKNGIGTCILEISSGIVIFLFNITLLRVSGKGAVAVFTVISNVGYAGKMIFTGIAQSGQPIISRNYGSKDIKNVKLGFRLTLYSAITFSLITYVLLLLFPVQILSLFITDNAQIITQNLSAVTIYFSSFVFTAINTMLMYYFQSLEKPKHTLVIAILRGIVLITICLGILPTLFGENGIWISLTVAEVVTTAIFLPIMFNLEKKLGKSFTSGNDHVQLDN
ncbi:MAG: MATE family efflux transporter, partial [Oscillospiraceae bacterium]